MDNLRETVFAVDFDGVVADGLDECLLTAWVAYRNLPLSRYNEFTLDVVPAELRDRFRRLRGCVRHDGHFLVPFLWDDPPATVSEFEDRYASLSESRRDSFRQAFANTRDKARSWKRDLWLRLNRVHEALLPGLRSDADISIVSGKDTGSIAEILAAHSVTIDPARIHGSLDDKGPVLRRLQAAADRRSRRLLFCDDNAQNVIDARASGIRALWADWGYSTADQRALVAESRIPRVSLGELAELLQGTRTVD
jgi:phosphoglycolate phosphatase-like HAD superfamily hydrolase